MLRKSWFAMCFVAFGVLVGNRGLAATLNLSVPSVVYPVSTNEYRLMLQGPAPVTPVFADKIPISMRIGNDEVIPIAACAPPGAAPKEGPWACFDAADTTPQTLAIELHSAPIGKVSFVITFKDDISNQLSTVLSWFGPTMTRVIALGATFVVAAIILGIISRGSAKPLANGETAKPLSAMLIDKATSTYSLSKMQLYVWLFAAAAAYLYLLAAKVLTQDQFVLIDVPQSIVAVALISISTTVLSTGTDSLSGGKGSGQFTPTPSDLMTSGGDVAPERVQQLLWTLIAAPGFVLFAYMSDPGSLQDIQGVPDHFLQLMGVSSAGYIGGKIARGAGPKISSLTACLDAGPPPFLILSIRGNDIQTVGASFSLRDIAKKVDQPEIPFPATTRPTSVIDSSGIATSLDLSVPAAGLRRPADGAKWQYAFTILAADGERAEWEF